MKSGVKKTISIITGLILLFNLISMEAHAAGVSIDVTSPSNGEFAASTATDVTFRYDPSSSEFSTSDTIVVSIEPALPNALTDCTSPTTDIDNDTSADGSFGSFTTSGATYTFSGSTTQATTNYATLCVRFPNTTTTDIYSISIDDDNDYDYGSTLVYVGDDNDVTVTATVTPVLSFAIRNSSDTSDTNACNLGVLDTQSVDTCSYRLKPSTNSSSGFTVQIASDGDLRRSGSGDVSDDLDIDLIIENNTVSSGTEGYGIALNGGSATGGSITEEGDFNDDDTPIPISNADLYSSNGPNAPGSTDTTNTALVTHRAAIDSETETGNYSHTVTYYVSASF
jgi:hypothetical protein